MEEPQFKKNINNTGEKKDSLELSIKKEEEVNKFLEKYLHREVGDDLREVLLDENKENSLFKNIKQKREEDVENIKNYKNGDFLKLKIFNTFFGIVNRVIINKKHEDGTYNAVQVSSDWKIKDENLHGELKEDELIRLIGLRYDLIEKILNTKIQPLLIGSKLKNSKDEVITILDIDLISGKMEIEYNGKKLINNYYKAIETSMPLQNHIVSIIRKI